MAREKTELRSDIQAAKDRAGATAGGGRELRKLESHLWEGETVEHVSTGVYGEGLGIVALTDRRLLFLKDGVMKQVSEDFPLDRVSSVQWNSGMLTGSIIVFVSGNKAEIKSVGKQVGKLIVDTVRGRISSKGAPASPASVAAQEASADDVFVQLEKLGALRDAGIVTSEEFDAKKAELLSRL
jgi:hypothetical protein